jgi:hypothetical protein
VIDDKAMDVLEQLIAKSDKLLRTDTGAVSVWRVMGAPKTKEGMRGARRGCCFLMPVTAEAGGVMTRFITECSRTDRGAFESAEVEVLDYLGWAWLPGYPIEQPANIKLQETKPESPEKDSK